MFKRTLLGLLLILSHVSWAENIPPTLQYTTPDKDSISTVKGGKARLLIRVQRSDFSKMDPQYKAFFSLDDNIALPEGFSFVNSEYCLPNVVNEYQAPCSISLQYEPKTVTPLSSLELPYTYTLLDKSGTRTVDHSVIKIPYQAVDGWAYAHEKLTTNINLAVDEENKLIYLPFSQGVGAVTEKEGLQWQFDLSAKESLLAMIFSSHQGLYLLSNSYLYAINPQGELKWKSVLDVVDVHAIMTNKMTTNKDNIYLARSNWDYNKKLSEVWMNIVDKKLTNKTNYNFTYPGFLSEITVDEAGTVYLLFQNRGNYGVISITAEGVKKTLREFVADEFGSTVLREDGGVYAVQRGVLYSYSPLGELEWSYGTQLSRPVLNPHKELYVTCATQTNKLCIAAVDLSGHEKGIYKSEVSVAGLLLTPIPLAPPLHFAIFYTQNSHYQDGNHLLVLDLQMDVSKRYNFIGWIGNGGLGNDSAGNVYVVNSFQSVKPSTFLYSLKAK